MADQEKRYAMAVDTKRCVGCGACVIACKTENRIPLGFTRDWITEEVRGRSPNLHMEIRSERCHQCSRPSCVSACPTGASHVSDGGVVMVNKNKCTGCKACMAACPYDARYVHPKGHVDKCTFCLHRLREGKTSACAEVCPTRAITVGDRSEPGSEVAELLRSRRHKTLHPETGADPNLYFLV